MVFELSEFQKRKVEHVFKIFYDVNGDNNIQWNDFEMALSKICEMHKWEPDSEKRRAARQTLWDVWQGLKKLADENRDDKVTKDEWLKMWTEVVKDESNQSELPIWLKNYRDFMFAVNDVSEDNVIDENEFVTVYTKFGVAKEDCELAFNKISNGGETAITAEKYSNLWKNYFFSNDQSSNANYLFGVHKLA